MEAAAMSGEQRMASEGGSLRFGERASSLRSLLNGVAVTRRNGESVETEEAAKDVLDRFERSRREKASVFIIGNGGSASIASHMANDFLNVGKLKAFTLHEGSVLTCMANDYGYDHAFARQLQTLASADDVLIAISSSGASPNIRLAAEMSRTRGMTVVTLSGFKPDNPLRGMGDLNFWVESRDYGMVEVAHLFILHYLADRMRIALSCTEIRP